MMPMSLVHGVSLQAVSPHHPAAQGDLYFPFGDGGKLVQLRTSSPRSSLRRTSPSQQSILPSASLAAAKAFGTSDNHFPSWVMTASPPMGPLRIKELIASETYNERLVTIIGVAQIFHNEQPVTFILLLLLLARYSLRGGTLLALVC